MAGPGKITELFVWIGTEASGGEGILAIQVGDGWTPMVTSKRELAELMREAADQIGEASGEPVTLRRFVLADINRGDLH
jgi:hypothetical protein